MPDIAVTDHHVDYERRQDQWVRVRDAIEGEDEVKDGGERYLPKPSGFSPNDYLAYLNRAVFYAISERTLRMLTGMVFRNAPKLDIPAAMEHLRHVLTTDEYSFEVTAEEILREVLAVGRYGMLCDMPQGDSNVPYIATYFAEDITDWHEEIIDGFKVLTRVVLREEVEDRVDHSSHYLELILHPDTGKYTARKWSVGVDSQGKHTEPVLDSEVVPVINGEELDRIPFVFVNPYDHRPRIDKPPFLDMVNMNMGHYRNSADYEHALFLTAQPTPWIAGPLNEGNTPYTIGGASAWILPNDTQVGFLEFTGAGLEAQRKAMEDKEARLAALGARMIHDGMNRNETTDTARMRGRSEISLLQNVVERTEHALILIFKIAAGWMNQNPEEVKIRLNRDWIETRLEPDALMSLVRSWQSQAISRQTLHENLQRGEIVPADRTWEEEKDLIDEEPVPLIEGLPATDRPGGTNPGNPISRNLP